MKALKNENTITQCAMILSYMKNGHAVTFYQAVKYFGCLHLPRRILDLKERGFDIKSYYIQKNGKKFKAYFIQEYYTGVLPVSGML